MADLWILDEVTSDFEAVSGQILYENKKFTSFVGLGSWPGCHD